MRIVTSSGEKEMGTFWTTENMTSARRMWVFMLKFLSLQQWSIAIVNHNTGIPSRLGRLKVKINSSRNELL